MTDNDQRPGLSKSFGADILDQINNSITVAEFIIIPSDQFDKSWSQSNSSFSIENRAMSIRNKVR